jgi:secreted trypsin-like serine protease
MRKLALLLSLPLAFISATAHASLNAIEDFSEPRIVAISNQQNVVGVAWANYSGYLYSPRIVFSAGHIKDHDEQHDLFVSQPNQKIESGMTTVKVIKVIYPETYKTKIYADDFSILILEKPLANVSSAPLITPELLAQAISAKNPMKQIGFGAYQDVCAEMKVAAPCQFGSERTSVVPRSIEMTPWDATGIQSKYNQYQAEIADHLFLTIAYKGGPCGGDSGGATTVNINTKNYYVGTVATGFWNAYACGQSPGYVGDTVGYTAPVYKFLNLISDAEKYVSEHPYLPPQVEPAPLAKPSPTQNSASSKYQYLTEIAREWAKRSRPTDTANKQCASARDRGLIYKYGKLTSIGLTELKIRNDLKTKSGFAACLNGFKK